MRFIAGLLASILIALVLALTSLTPVARATDTPAIFGVAAIQNVPVPAGTSIQAFGGNGLLCGNTSAIPLSGTGFSRYNYNLSLALCAGLTTFTVGGQAVPNIQILCPPSFSVARVPLNVP